MSKAPGLLAPGKLHEDLWRGLPVLLTGHTGFKGSWLSLYLQALGAEVHGYSLAPLPGPQLFNLARVRESLASHHEGDVTDAKHLLAIMRSTKPRLVLHLAAQSLVRRSYVEPLRTWSTNVMGTANLLDAVRQCEWVQAAVVVSSDKCYENLEQSRPFSEEDRLGGHDPYSASKAATEIVAHSYRHSYGGPDGAMKTLLATARAGNVIGGGDFSEDRLVADAARACQAQQMLAVRNPDAIRPWQHVLEALNGYLLLAQALLEQYRGSTIAGEAYDQSFNFGPSTRDNQSVSHVLSYLKRHWPELQWESKESDGLREAKVLSLNSDKACLRLGWQPRWSLDEGLARTAEWYRAWSAGQDMVQLTRSQLRTYMNT